MAVCCIYCLLHSHCLASDNLFCISFIFRCRVMPAIAMQNSSDLRQGLSQFSFSDSRGICKNHWCTCLQMGELIANPSVAYIHIRVYAYTSANAYQFYVFYFDFHLKNHCECDKYMKIELFMITFLSVLRLLHFPLDHTYYIDKCTYILNTKAYPEMRHCLSSACLNQFNGLTSV